MLAQEQTWFGNEVWKSYGIQVRPLKPSKPSDVVKRGLLMRCLCCLMLKLLPLTPASELRDDGPWVSEMLPVFAQSCLKDHNCLTQGWTILIYTALATIGQWQEAWEGVNELDPSVYDTAGGNGHSRTNTLWYIATRPEYPAPVDTSLPGANDVGSPVGTPGFYVPN